MSPELMSVSEYVEYVNGLVAITPVLVEGEVSNAREVPGRNFRYFDIKDKSSVAKCFQGFWRSSKTELENGNQIKVLGFPSLQRNGSLVIDVREIEMAGEGSLMRQYLKLKEKLEKEGLFEQKHKKQLPDFPSKIGLIAGKNSSAYHDVAAEISERWKGSTICFLPSKVQGIYAKKEITQAIRFFNKKKPVDVLIVARGGGSLEDLQAFDSEEVVREMFASKIPLISAIGHEDHWTLSDFVSDKRAKTPTKAAQFAVPDSENVSQRLQYYLKHLELILKQQLEERLGGLDLLQKKAENLKTAKMVDAQRGCDELLRRSNDSISKVIENFQNKLLFWEKSLELANPQRVLERGFAVIERGGKRVFNIGDVSCGDKIVTSLQDGSFEGTINRKFEKNVERKIEK